MNDYPIGYLIKLINDRLKTKADADLKSAHLTLAQSRVLAFINQKGGQTTQKEVETYLDVAHPTVVGIISRMEQNGFVACCMDPSDHRNKIVKLTRKAENAGKDMEKLISEHEELLLRNMSAEEKRELQRLLEIVSKNID